MNKIADYDTYDYDYSTYWAKREYEHKAEVIVLNKILKNVHGQWFLDIGGSFGRLTSTYSKQFSNLVIIDYSLKTLQKNYKALKKKYPNLELIAANAYFLPFKDKSFDGGLMVRVLHHIEKPKQCLEEIYRTMDEDGVYIQEYANKLHIKAILRAIFTLNFNIFSKKPYQQPNKDNNEGAKKGSKVLFFNYHPQYIINLFKEIHFTVLKTYGCSFLRLNILKKLFKSNILLFWEKIFQQTLSWTNISPSIFVKTVKLGKREQNKPSTLKDILVCPDCKSSLNFNAETAICSQCKKSFTKKENIWDFRI